MSVKLRVDNIKCGGCANSIRQKLTQIEWVEQVDVAVAAGEVSLVFSGQASDSQQQQAIESIKEVLKSMGYPEAGSLTGLDSAGAKAKSFVSCAVGKMSDQSS